MKQRVALSLVALLLQGPCSLLSAKAGQVFDCQDASGKVTYSTVPCAVQSRRAPSQTEASDYETFYGEWRGQTKFQQSDSSAPDGRTSLLTPLTLMIEEGGKVSGASEDSGCRILGVARPGPLPTESALDLTVSSCRNHAFNRKYTGSLALYPRQGYATIHLVSLARPDSGTTYDIGATLQR